jgi:acyl-CoA thioesterase-1
MWQLQFMEIVRFFGRLACVLAGIGFMTHVAAAQSGPALPHVERRLEQGQILHIVAFGSSSTEGIGASSKAANYPNQLQDDLAGILPQNKAVVVINRGIGGEDVDDMMRRLPEIVAEKPDLVIWQTGSNDPLRNVPLDRFIALTRVGISRMQAAGIDVMLMGPQLCRRLNANATTNQFRDALRAIGEQMGVPVIRRYSLMRDWLVRKELTDAQLLSPDGLHMADGGYARLAKVIAREILRDSRRHSAVIALN